jgi:hypothetical protein
LEFFTNDTHADATPWILKRRLKWRRKVAEDLVGERETKDQQPCSSGSWGGEI